MGTQDQEVPARAPSGKALVDVRKVCTVQTQRSRWCNGLLTIHLTKEPIMMRSQISVSLAFAGILFIAANGMNGQETPIPPGTAIPVIFTHAIDAGKAKPSDIVTAKTSQVVFLPGGRVLPKGATVSGHVTESTAFVFDSAPYAVQKPSVLSIHFDKVAVNGLTIPVSLSVRAISDPVQTHEAEMVHYVGDFDSTGTRILIGGSSFSPLESAVASPNGDVAGYVREQGVFARLIAGDELRADSALHCSGTNGEQSINIFSANACGVYGFNAMTMSDIGKSNGTFVLESRRHNVKLYAGSATLLQVTEPGSSASL